MILDKEVMYADELAYDGVPEEIDLGAVNPGPGQPIKIFVQGSADLADCTGFNVLDSATATADTVAMTVVADLIGKIVEVELPSHIKQFTTIALTSGTAVSAGSFSAGIVMPGVQTNT